MHDKTCNPNIPGGNCGQTPLHYAAVSGHLHIAKYLIEGKAAIHHVWINKSALAPLHCAAIKEHMDIVKFLIVEKCCDPLYM